jgi:hypothetical protein
VTLASFKEDHISQIPAVRLLQHNSAGNTFRPTKRCRLAAASYRAAGEGRWGGPLGTQLLSGDAP